MQRCQSPVFHMLSVNKLPKEGRLDWVSEGEMTKAGWGMKTGGIGEGGAIARYVGLLRQDEGV